MPSRCLYLGCLGFVLLLGGACAANSSDGPCSGEFELNPATDECDLIANFGDVDEPIPETYELALRHLNRNRVRAACDLNHKWSCGGVECDITQDASGASFDVKTVNAPKGFLWGFGKGTLTKDARDELRVVNVSYWKSGDSPSSAPFTYRTGTINDDCASIEWSDFTEWTCNDSSCPAPKNETIDVHIICHTHDDTGYLRTVDEYYESNVQHILTTVTEELQKNPARRFSYVEIKFFAMWWELQTEDTKTIVRKLVADGQLDFSNGGWCMPDEGAPSYHDMVDNMQKGLLFIEKEFGPAARPTTAWSIDPFGHSSTYATLNAMFGFDFFVVGRIDFQEKAKRFATQTMETMWRPSRVGGAGASPVSPPSSSPPQQQRSQSQPSQPQLRQIMTHVLDPIQFYGYPPGFNFEGDARSRITDANIGSRADDFAKFIKRKREGYATNSLLVPFGSDFQFTTASINYENLDKLMAYMNTDENVRKYGMRLQYSTPTRYMRTLHAKNTSFPLKQDDFETYAIGPAQFLVGFYSSRPDFKGFIRMASTQLRTAHTLLTNGLVGADIGAGVNVTAELASLGLQDDALGVSQHHDAITSSQTRHVHRDYIAKLSAGQKNVDATLGRVVGAIVGAEGGGAAAAAATTDEKNVTRPSTMTAAAATAGALATCPYLNESACDVSTTALSGGQAVAVLLVNPLSASTRTPSAVKVPVPADTDTDTTTAGGGQGRSYTVSRAQAQAQPVTSQLLPAWPHYPHVHNFDAAPTAAALHGLRAACDLNHKWSCGGVECDITQDASGASFDVKTVNAPKGFLWGFGKGVVTKNAQGELRVVNVSYWKSGDSPSSAPFTSRTGTINDDCASIAWSDSSHWTCDDSGCPQPDFHPTVAPQPTVVFGASVPAAGIATYLVSESKSKGESEAKTQAESKNEGSSTVATPSTVRSYAFPRDDDDVDRSSADLDMENGLLRVHFDAATGLLSAITKKAPAQQAQQAQAQSAANLTVAVRQTLQWYNASTGGKGGVAPGSGADPAGSGSGNYIFQPYGNKTYGFGARAAGGQSTSAGLGPVNVTVVRGPVVQEVRHVYASTTPTGQSALQSMRVEQVFRLYEWSDVLEIEYRVGPIDISDGLGKEVISRFDTDIDSGEIFGTDVNGMLMASRMRNNRSRLWYPANAAGAGEPGPDYFACTEPVACNYFAVNGIATLTDRAQQQQQQRRRLSVLTDRSEGSTSMSSGQLELMLHRRLAHGCRWGMCSDGHESAGLNDTLGNEVLIKHWLTIDSVTGASQLAKNDQSNGNGDAGGNNGGNSDSPVFAASPSLARVRSRELNYPPSTLFGTAATAADWARTHVKHVSFAPFAEDPFGSADGTDADPNALANGFPANVELSNFMLLNATHLVLRLTHIFAEGEHPTLSASATVDFCAAASAGQPSPMGSRVCDMLKRAVPSGLLAAETSAAANIGLADLEHQRLNWIVAGDDTGGASASAVPSAAAPAVPAASASAAPWAVVMQPGDTRTFVIPVGH